MHKGYIVTDGHYEMAVCAETRSQATGIFINHFGARWISWKRLRTKREPDLDGPTPWQSEMGDYVEWWGATVRMP